MDLNKLEQLEKLNDLKEKGLLSAKEFETAKKDILNSSFQQNTQQQPTAQIPSVVIQNSATAIAKGVGEKKRYSVVIAFLLCLFGGWLGLHRFYTGYPFSGFIYMISFGFFGIGWFLDFIRILFGSYRDPDGRTLG